jgi:hypothetical protein
MAKKKKKKKQKKKKEIWADCKKSGVPVTRLALHLHGEYPLPLEFANFFEHVIFFISMPLISDFAALWSFVLSF